MTQPLDDFSIEPADLDWSRGLPVSRRFGDVYFSQENGLAETDHVFLQGNQLASRLAALDDHQLFIVGETGFGTGLNLLALWQLWQTVRPTNRSRLHFISTERFPLKVSDLARALALWPTLQPMAQALLAQYPPLVPGVHRLIFAEERLSVDLWFGDAVSSLHQVQTQQAVDAWFLDGFAPSCNPELWQAQVFHAIAQLSDAGTTLASFSVAGVVKTGLRSLGATISRRPGFGRKREMLCAHWTDKPVVSMSVSATQVQRTSQRIAVIGAGIAGLSVARALSWRGQTVTLFDAAPLSGASGNPRALLSPKLTPLRHVSDHLATLGWLSTSRWWRQWRPAAIAPTGNLTLPADLRLADYPDEMVQLQTQSESEGLAGVDLNTAGHYVPLGALIEPQLLAETVLAHPQVTWINTAISDLKLNDHDVVLLGEDQTAYTFDAVVLATSLASNVLLPKEWGKFALNPVRGQLSWCPTAVGPSLPLNYGGYCAHLPSANPALLLGATFIRQSWDQTVTEADHVYNLAQLKAVATEYAATLPPVTQWQGRASLRAQTRDYLPLAGWLTPQLGVLTGLGSKGFSFAPLCAEVLISQRLGEPVPLPHRLIERLDPKRALTPRTSTPL